MSLLDKLNQKTKKGEPNNLSLVGNNFNPQTKSPAFGYVDSTNNLNPRLSRLHNTYSVDGIPKIRIIDFNKSPYKSELPPPSGVDELDKNAPNFNIVQGGVVSKIYKSKQGRNYRDLGPAEGRY
jgi:hypothetical protein